MTPALSFPAPLPPPSAVARALTTRREAYATKVYRAAYRAERRARADLAAAQAADPAADPAALAHLLGFAPRADSLRDLAAAAVRAEWAAAVAARRGLDAQDALAAEMDMPLEAAPDPRACTPCVLLPPHPVTGVRWWVIPTLKVKAARGALIEPDTTEPEGWRVARLAPGPPGEPCAFLYVPLRFIPSCIA